MKTELTRNEISTWFDVPISDVSTALRRVQPVAYQENKRGRRLDTFRREDASRALFDFYEARARMYQEKSEKWSNEAQRMVKLAAKE